MEQKVRVLVLGATGMLGHVLVKKLHGAGYDVFGTVRSSHALENWFSAEEKKVLISNVDADNFQSIINAIRISKPEVVINCIGIIKHLPLAKNHLSSIEINALFPHKLANLCEIANARLIQVSTDCVFTGEKGNYTETDRSDADDVYGKTKFLGEVEYSHALTLRTSIIGHELQSNIALVDWFLSQSGVVKGYSNAIYTGLTTYELAEMIIKVVFRDTKLTGVYHVASNKISKYDLLQLIAATYKKRIDLQQEHDFSIDRSLVAERLYKATGYLPPTWGEMIHDMHGYYNQWHCYEAKKKNCLQLS